MFSIPDWDYWMYIRSKLKGTYLCKSSNIILGQFSIHCNSDKMFRWMPKSIEPWRAFPLTSHTCWITFFHIDTYDIIDVIIGCIPASTIPMLYTGLFYNIIYFSRYWMPFI